MQQCAVRQFENELVECLSILANRHLRPPAPERGPHSIYEYYLGDTTSLPHAGPGSYGTRSPLKNIRARGRIIFLFFPRAARAR